MQSLSQVRLHTWLAYKSAGLRPSVIRGKEGLQKSSEQIQKARIGKRGSQEQLQRQESIRTVAAVAVAGGKGVDRRRSQWFTGDPVHTPPTRLAAGQPRGKWIATAVVEPPSSGSVAASGARAPAKELPTEERRDGSTPTESTGRPRIAGGQLSRSEPDGRKPGEALRKGSSSTEANPKERSGDQRDSTPATPRALPSSPLSKGGGMQSPQLRSQECNPDNGMQHFHLVIFRNS